MQILSPLPILALILGLALADAGAVAGQNPSETAQPRSAQAEMAQGLNDGAMRAESIGTGGYFAAGFASGFFLGFIGTGITYAVAASSDVTVRPGDRVLMADQSPEYMQGYQSAYTERVRARRKSSGLIGGLLGTATLVAIVLSSS